MATFSGDSKARGFTVTLLPIMVGITVIDSVPAPMAMSHWPVMIFIAASATALRPLAQKRFTAVNRFCASGLNAVADAAMKIMTGQCDIAIGAGTESMTVMPTMMGNKVTVNPRAFESPENVAIAYGMGLTAEKVAHKYAVSREDQDAFALASHQKALAAIAAGRFA